MGSVEVPGYTVRKEGRNWFLYKNDVPVVDDFDCQRSFKRRKDAVAAIPEIIASEEYEARLRREDITGNYVWIKEESASIDELATALKLNLPAKGFFDRRGLQERARSEYIKDAYTILSWYAWEKSDWPGNLICVELRRRRAARREAFKKAGIEFDPNFYQLVCRNRNRPEQEPHDFRHETVAECEKERDEIIGRCGPNEAYDFEITPVPPAWPTDRIATQN